MFSTEKPVILAGNSHHGKAGPGQSKCYQQLFHDFQSCIAHLFSVCPRDTKRKTLQAKCPATITGGRIAILPGSSQWETSFNTWRDSKCSVALICMIPVKWEKNSNPNLDMGNVDRFTIHDSVAQVCKKELNLWHETVTILFRIAARCPARYQKVRKGNLWMYAFNALELPEAKHGGPDRVTFGVKEKQSQRASSWVPDVRSKK